MPTVLALADVGADQRQPLGGPEGANALQQLGLGKIGVRVADRCQQLVFGIAIPVDELHRRRVLDRRATEQRVDELGGALTRRHQIVGPATTTVGKIDAAQEAGDDLAQLVQHQIGVLPGLGQRMGTHAQQHPSKAWPLP